MTDDFYYNVVSTLITIFSYVFINFLYTFLGIH